jgi:RNA polymerase sigma factor (sigma-70 family)
VEPNAAIDAVWKIESAKLIAALVRVTRDVGLAEDLAQDALVAALEQWPAEGIPRNPAAWLMAIAKRRGIDHFRHHTLAEHKHQQLVHEVATHHVPDFDAALEDEVGDDLLRLIFTACHPVLPTEARVALTLKLLAGFTTPEIARAFLAPEPTIQQRIVRAKRTLADKKVPYEVPAGPELAVRLASVLEVIYLIFNEGYSATAGDDWMRPALCEDAQRLGRVLAGLAPMEPEVHGLVALMEIQASRAAARIGPTGEPVLLLDQDRRRWNRLLIQRGLAALERAEQLALSGVEGLGRERGPYTLQAAIAACHARASEASHTDWTRIAGLYDALARLRPSPVVELNRAVAHGMAFGPPAGLVIADRVAHEPMLKDYPYLPGVRGDLLFKLQRFDEARQEFLRAAALTQNESQKKLLLQKAAEADAPGTADP